MLKTDPRRACLISLCLSLFISNMGSAEIVTPSSLVSSSRLSRLESQLRRKAQAGAKFQIIQAATGTQGTRVYGCFLDELKLESLSVETPTPGELGYFSLDLSDRDGILNFRALPPLPDGKAPFEAKQSMSTPIASLSAATAPFPGADPGTGGGIGSPPSYSPSIIPDGPEVDTKWVQSVSGLQLISGEFGDDYANNVATDGDSVYMVGDFREKAFFGLSPATGTVSTKSISAYVARYNVQTGQLRATPQGTPWVKNGFSQKPGVGAIDATFSTSSARTVAIVPGDAIYVSGAFKNVTSNARYLFGPNSTGGYFEVHTSTQADRPTPGTQEGFIAKIKTHTSGILAGQKEGDVVWVSRIYTSGNAASVISASDVDGAGNLYVAGDFTGTIKCKLSTGAFVTSQAGAGLFIAKFSPGGSCSWMQTYSTSDSKINSLKVISNSQNPNSPSILVTGQIGSSVTFGGTNLSTPVNAFFVARFEGSTPTPSWAHIASNAVPPLPLASWGSGITADTQGNIYLTGSFRGTQANVGHFAFSTSPSLGLAGGQNGFISKLSPMGAVLWLKQVTTSDLSNQRGVDLRGLSVDSLSNVSVVGSFSQSAALSPEVTVVSSNSTTSYQEPLFFQLNGSGSPKWVRRLSIPNSPGPVSFSGIVALPGFRYGISGTVAGTYTAAGNSIQTAGGTRDGVLTFMDSQATPLMSATELPQNTVRVSWPMAESGGYTLVYRNLNTGGSAPVNVAPGVNGNRYEIDFDLNSAPTGSFQLIK